MEKGVPPPQKSSATAFFKSAFTFEDERTLVRSYRLTPERGRVGHIALVVIHVGFGQVGGIHHGVGFTEIQVDVEFEFLGRHRRAQLFESRLRGLATFQAPENFLRPIRGIADINLGFHHRRGGLTDGVNDAAPIRVAPVPTRFHERTVRDRSRSGIGVLNCLRAVYAHGHDAMHAFAVAHNFLREL